MLYKIRVLICVCIVVLFYTYSDLVISFPWGQNYSNLLHNLVTGSVSLNPLTSSIQELACAAEEAEQEAKVIKRTLLDIVWSRNTKFPFISFCIHFLSLGS